MATVLPAPARKPCVLVIDDEPDLVELVCLTLGRMGLATRSAGDVAEARALLGTERFDLCLTDMRLPDGDGLDLVEWIQTHVPQLPVAVITAHGNVEAAVRALKLGAFDFVSKPLDLSVLRKLVASAVRLKAGSVGERGEAMQTPHAGDAGSGAARLVGRSASMEQLRALIARVARSQAPVYICGESGTGKELVARLVHESGPRRDGPFVAVNCGAIPSELMESELFGHKRGAFTGAISEHRGLVAAAEGGTLFLDEVADLPLHMQVKLLRVIQEKAIRPVGESRETSVDVRILSATHKNLAQLVRQGRFREDLYYRINVIELRVPSLRERPEDIEQLAQTILGRLAARLRIAPPRITPAALARLRGYAFPGNVRELENILERALTMSDGQSLDAPDIDLRGAPLSPAVDAPASDVATDAEHAEAARDGTDSRGAAQPNEAAPAPLGSQLEGIERAAIVRALEETRYNRTAAAKRLGLTFRALRYRMKKLGIE